MVPIMDGASETEDGRAGLVPVPLKNQHDFVLLGDGTWSSGLKDLTATVSTLIGADADMSAREIAESVFETYVGNLDDLKDLVDWLETNPDFTDYNRRLAKVEGTLYDQGSKADNTWIPGLTTVVSRLEVKVDDVYTELENIYERLTWQEMDD